VCINTGMNISRARADETRLNAGTLSQAGEKPEPKGWEVLPYPTGLLEAYIRRHAPDPERHEFLPHVFKRLSVDAAVAQLAGCDVVGFSAYIWNIRHSLKIARKLKELHPETLVVFGGPQTPDTAERFLREHPFIDLAVHGEGERVFMSILENYQQRSWDAIPSISFLGADGSFVHHPKCKRLTDLDLIPPVYSAGIFDRLMQANPEIQWLALLETNRGCPFACTFCDWGSATNSKVFQFGLSTLYQEMEWIGRNKIENVFCCDANFGILTRDEEITESICRVRATYDYPKVFATQNTKNSTERSYRIQKRLSEADLSGGVTLSFQSLDPDTLRNVKRDNISIGSFSELQHRYTRDGITTYTDIILGMPGETYDSFVDGLTTIVEGGQHNYLFFYNCSILPNAAMAEPGYVREHGLTTVEQEIVAVHTSLEECRREETPEYFQTIVSTKSMPPEDWVKSKAIWWMADLVYFGRLLQIPFVLMHELYHLEYGRLIEALTTADRRRYPVVGSIMDFYNEKARDIQNGGWEFCPSERWLNITWPANQYALITLVTENTLERFYDEAKGIVLDYVREHVTEFSSQLVTEAINFNRSLVRVPYAAKNLKVTLFHNVWEFYQGVLAGTPVELEERVSEYGILRTRPLLSQFDDWLEHVVFCQNMKQSYLYTVLPLTDTVAERLPPPGAAISLDAIGNGMTNAALRSPSEVTSGS